MFPDLSAEERQSGLVALSNAMRSVASLLLMCDPRDLGIAFTEDLPGSIAQFEPNLYLYDVYPGGIGQSAPLFRLTPLLLRRTWELIDSCGCPHGCPSCVGPVGEVGERGKEAALRFLAAMSE
jgi:DEAD/DEAH box helicase domain-containing protein